LTVASLRKSDSLIWRFERPRRDELEHFELTCRELGHRLGQAVAV
jgi:hypothetical protein